LKRESFHFIKIKIFFYTNKKEDFYANKKKSVTMYLTFPYFVLCIFYFCLFICLYSYLFSLNYFSLIFWFFTFFCISYFLYFFYIFLICYWTEKGSLIKIVKYCENCKIVESFLTHINLVRSICPRSLSVELSNILYTIFL